MKYISISEFLNYGIAKRLSTLKLIAAGAVRIKEEKQEVGKVNVVETRVKEILELYPETRENDNLLYVTYVEEYHYVDFKKDTFINYEQYGLPSFKTVERARRKIQNEQFCFRASEGIEESRREAEKNYIENFMR